MPNIVKLKARFLAILLVLAGVVAPAPTNIFAADPATEAVSEGLSLTVAPTKARFGEDENPRFTLTFKNVSDKPFQLWGPEVGDSGSLSFAGPEAGPWQAVLNVRRFRLHAVMTPRWTAVLLKAGESKDFPLVLNDDTRFMYVREEQEGLPALERLPKGKYQFVLRRWFHEDKTAQGGAPFWTGGIESKPAVFEIGKPE